MHYDFSPYNAFDNDPVFWADPSGTDANSMFGTDLDGERRYDKYGLYIPKYARDRISSNDNGTNYYGESGSRIKKNLTIRVKENGNYIPILIIKTALIKYNINIDINLEKVPEIDVITNKFKETKPIVFENLDNYLENKFEGIPDAVYVNFGAQFLGVSSGIQVALFTTGKDAGGAFLYTPKNPVDPTFGILVGGGIEIGGIESKTKIRDFDRFTLQGKSINYMGGYKNLSGSVTTGVNNFYNFLSPTYVGIAFPIFSDVILSVKYGFAVSFSETTLSAILIEPKQ